MSRPISHRYKINCTLEAVSPIHVGGMGDNALVDLPLAVNGRGEYYFPGTSLAGALRAWMQQWNLPYCEKLWGFQEERNDRGHASFVVVEDAPVHLPNGAIPEIRDGVGIDRDLGTAADRIKFDRAIVPRGSWFPLEMTLEVMRDGEPDQVQVKESINLLMTAIEYGDVRLGAAKTRGLGRIRLKGEPEIFHQELLTPAGIIAALRGKSSDSYQYQRDRRVSPQLGFTITWKPRGAVMVKAEGEGIAVNILPLTSVIDDKIALVLPGSSIKGALRFQAERILRTLRIPEKASSTTSNDESDKAKQKFFNRLELPLIETIFGTSKTKEPAKNSGTDPLPGLGALWVEDCWSQLQMMPQHWQAIAQASDDKNLRDALDNAGLENTQQAYHVAVDRWTGGAAEWFLYSNLEPFSVQWDELHLTLNFNRLPKNEQLPAVALMLLILRDLSQNRIPLGYNTNRGMGAIEVKDIFIQGAELAEIYLESLEGGVHCKEGKISNLDSVLLETLNAEWKNWIESHQTQAEIL